MTVPPPLRDDKHQPQEKDGWRKMARPLDIEGHDIWVFMLPEQPSLTQPRSECAPAEFGDLEPDPNGPDPEVWPLDGYDPGAQKGYDMDDLILTTNSFPVPHVRWVTPDFLVQRYGYDPRQMQVDVPSSHQTNDQTTSLRRIQ